jgi:hypothetical protein
MIRLRNPDSRAVDERYLAEYNMVRSLQGRSRPRQLALGSWRYLIGEYPNGLLPPMTEERMIFTETLARRGVTAVPLEPSPDAVYDALNQPDFDVLHIACHASSSSDPAIGSRVIIGDRLAGGEVQPLTLDPITVREEARLSARQPLVFADVWGDWSRTFWEAGASAVVTRSLPVFANPARAFAETFYGALLDGETLARAAGAGRGRAKRFGDATWLAYRVYGEPTARKA